jgi:hypothetical protein
MLGYSGACERVGHGLHHLSTLVASLPPLEDRLALAEGGGFWD